MVFFLVGSRALHAMKMVEKGKIEGYLEGKPVVGRCGAGDWDVLIFEGEGPPDPVDRFDRSSCVYLKVNEYLKMLEMKRIEAELYVEGISMLYPVSRILTALCYLPKPIYCLLVRELLERDVKRCAESYSMLSSEEREKFDRLCAKVGKKAGWEVKNTAEYLKKLLEENRRVGWKVGVDTVFI